MEGIDEIQYLRERVENLELELAERKERFFIGVQILKQVFYDSLNYTKDVNLSFKDLVTKWGRKIRKGSQKDNDRHSVIELH
jgi:hypothetical protein